MGLFDDALKKGAENLATRERNSAEIGVVLREASEAITRFSGAEVRLIERARPADTSFVGMLTSMARESKDAIPTLYAEGRGGQQPLCDFRRGALGYPVTIGYSNVLETCSDIEGLRRGLAKALQHPAVVESISRVAKSMSDLGLQAITEK